MVHYYGLIIFKGLGNLGTRPKGKFLPANSRFFPFKYSMPFLLPGTIPPAPQDILARLCLT